jgi:hypothetical protein
MVSLLVYIQGVTTIYETGEIFLVVGQRMLKYFSLMRSQQVLSLRIPEDPHRKAIKHTNKNSL